MLYKEYTSLMFHIYGPFTFVVGGEYDKKNKNTFKTHFNIGVLI